MLYSVFIFNIHTMLHFLFYNNKIRKIVFIVWFVLRFIINDTSEVNVFKEYINLISIAYYGAMATFSCITTGTYRWAIYKVIFVVILVP